MRSVNRLGTTCWNGYSDRSRREGRAAAGILFGDQSISIRLPKVAFILQAELVGIINALLVDTDPYQHPVERIR